MKNDTFKFDHVDTRETIGSDYHIAANCYIYKVEYNNKTYIANLISDYINHNELKSLLRDGMEVGEALEEANQGGSHIYIETDSDEHHFGDEVTGAEYDELCALLDAEFREVKKLQHGFEVDNANYFLENLEEEQHYEESEED